MLTSVSMCIITMQNYIKISHHIQETYYFGVSKKKRVDRTDTDKKLNINAVLLTLK